MELALLIVAESSISRKIFEKAIPKAIFGSHPNDNEEKRLILVIDLYEFKVMNFTLIWSS